MHPNSRLAPRADRTTLRPWTRRAHPIDHRGGPYVGVSRVDIARRLHAMMTAVQMERAELSVLLTDDEQIKELNRIYRKKNRPTDVLAFAQQEGWLVVEPISWGRHRQHPDSDPASPVERA